MAHRNLGQNQTYLGDAVADGDEVDPESKLSGDVGQRVARGLGGQG